MLHRIGKEETPECHCQQLEEQSGRHVVEASTAKGRREKRRRDKRERIESFFSAVFGTVLLQSKPDLSGDQNST